MDIQKLMLDFVEHIKKEKVEIYNEASIQYEFAIFLRGRVGDRKIQLERNVSYFRLGEKDFLKKEIDIAIFSEDKKEKTAIEIKFPINGQVPAQMFSFCTDVNFLEELKGNGFKNNLFIAFTNDHLFWEGEKKEGIYAPFRRSGELGGTLKDPFSPEKITFKDKYVFKWQDGFLNEYGQIIKFFFIVV